MSFRLIVYHGCSLNLIFIYFYYVWLCDRVVAMVICRDTEIITSKEAILTNYNRKKKKIGLNNLKIIQLFFNVLVCYTSSVKCLFYVLLF